MHLIVGLGNPGEKYAHTRHNVGFDVLSLLSEKLSIPITRHRFQSLVGEGLYHGEKVVLCKPQTYMNLSGEAVQQLMQWYKLPMENLLVVYDDIDLAPGWIRIRKNGSAGTHNGMRSIINSIGSNAFPRIRVGIGGCPPSFALADWVTSHYNTPQERQDAFDAYLIAADAAIEWLQNGLQSAMNQFNTKKPKLPKQSLETAASAELPSAASPSVAATEPASNTSTTQRIDS